jgi:hypothetical protein
MNDGWSVRVQEPFCARATDLEIPCVCRFDGPQPASGESIECVFDFENSEQVEFEREILSRECERSVQPTSRVQVYQQGDR